MRMKRIKETKCVSPAMLQPVSPSRAFTSSSNATPMAQPVLTRALVLFRLTGTRRVT